MNSSECVKPTTCSCPRKTFHIYASYQVKWANFRPNFLQKVGPYGHENTKLLIFCLGDFDQVYHINLYLYLQIWQLYKVGALKIAKLVYKLWLIAGDPTLQCSWETKPTNTEQTCHIQGPSSIQWFAILKSSLGTLQDTTSFLEVGTAALMYVGARKGTGISVPIPAVFFVWLPTQSSTKFNWGFHNDKV